MSYSGVQPVYGTFPSDLFTGNGSNTVFTMSSVPGNDAALLVTVDGVRQHTDTYSYTANTLTFSEAPGSGAIIETVNMGSRADVIITEGVYKKTQFTATASQTNFTIATGYTVGFVDVYLNGIRLVVADDFTATDGSTIILAAAAASGDAVEVVAYGTFNVANALLKSGDTMSGNLVVSGTSTLMSPVAIANNSGNTFVVANTGAVTIGGTIAATGNISTTSQLLANGDIKGITATNPTIWSSNSAALTDGSMYMQLNTTSSEGRIGTYTSHPLVLMTGNSRQVIIDTTGRVTIPNQPKFMARKYTGGSTAVAQNNVITYEEALYNIGSCLNTSTGRFTAPIAGTYAFFWSNIGGSSATVHRTWIRKNGSDNWGAGYKFEARNYTTQAYPYGSNQVVVTLAAADYVDIYYAADTGSSYLYADTTDGPMFCGYLIG